MPASIPPARVVRTRGVAVAPPRLSLRERLAAVEDALGPRMRGFVAAVLGLWPVTAVVLLAAGLMWIIALQNAP